MSPDENSQQIRLSEISTSWRKVENPARFVMLYGSAMRAYLVSLVRNADHGDEILQDILLSVTTKGFPTYDQTRGRFRDYLKTILRNAASKFLQRKQAAQALDAQLDMLSTNDNTDDFEWRSHWQSCLISATWRALDRHQRSSGQGNLSFTVLRISVDHPHLTSVELSQMVSEGQQNSLSPEAFRKQLSRAKRTFAELLLLEVQQTLDSASDETILEELADLHLLEYIKPYL